MARIDLDGDDSQDDLAEALQQLEQRQKGPAAPETEQPSGDESAKRRAQRERKEGHRRSREEIQGAVEAIRERQETERASARSRTAASPVRWIIVAAVGAVAIVLAAIFFRPEPLPEPAVTPEAAVRGFWESLSQDRYQAATVYYPSLVDKYGSRKQAAVYLKQNFEADPPRNVTVGEAEELPDTTDLRVSFEMWRRSGRPRAGEFIVRHSEDDGGYIIVAGQ
jgi:hypothetical protein